MDMFSNVAESFSNNLIVEDRYRMILDGLQVTLLITLFAAVLGTILGGLVCWMRMSRRRWLQQVARVYIDLMRGTTGWFLPSAQQWVKMMTGLGGLKASDISKWWDWFDQSHTAVDNWEAAFKKAGSGNYDSMIPHLCYWSSSESSDEGALGLYVDAAGPVGDCGFYWSHNYKNRRYDDYRVRPVLAF